MNNWFTVDKIDNDTYAISEYKHWEETHCYLLLGTKKALLIDTGLGVANISEVVKTITNLPIVVVTTHVHWDHIGGHKYFDDIAVYEDEKDWITDKFPIPLAVVKSNLMKEPHDFPKDFDINSYTIYQKEPTRVLKDNEIIDIGGRQLQVIHTPGHSPGHICIYEENRQYLFSGDLIYEGCLFAFYPTTNPIDFRNSVHKIKNMNIKRVLPAHHKLNINVNLIIKISDAFDEIYDEGKLVQGNGVFKFDGFEIYI